MQSSFLNIRLYFLILILSAFATSNIKSVHAQEQNWTSVFYKHYLEGDMVKWANSLEELKASYKNNPSQSILLEILKAQYGLIAYYIGSEQDNKADNELEDAWKYLQKAKQEKLNKVLLMSLEGAFTSFEMSISPYKIPFLGQESKTLIEEAYKLNPNLPQARFEYANYKFYAPGFAGGDENLAIQEYKNTIILLEQINQIKDWYYLWALTALSNAYAKQENHTELALMLKKIKNTEPNYKWVHKQIEEKKSVLPNLNFE